MALLEKHALPVLDWLASHALGVGLVLVCTSASVAGAPNDLPCVAQGRESLAKHRASMAKLRDLDLDPRRISFAELKKLLGEPVDVGYDADNTTHIGWLMGPTSEEEIIRSCREKGKFYQIWAVDAIFIVPSGKGGEHPPNTSRPIEISIAPPFPGAIRGLRLVPTTDEFVRQARTLKYAVTKDRENLGWYVISLDDAWKIDIFHRPGVPLGSIRLENRKYFRIPR